MEKNSVQTSQLIHYSVLVRSVKIGEDQYEKWWNDDFPKRLAASFYSEYLIGSFVIGEEVTGKNNNYFHLQCYLRLRKRKRVHEVLQLLLSLYEWPDPSLVQVQKSPTTRTMAAYCQKDGKFWTEKDFNSVYEKKVLSLELNDAQKEICEVLYEDSSDRKIVVVQNESGGIGKTTLIKRFLIEKQYDVFLFPQSGSLMSNLYCYARWFLSVRSGPTDKQVLVAINCPKSDHRLAKKESTAEFLSSVESIKDACFSCCFNGKLLTVNADPSSVRVIIMTNREPNIFYDGLSSDRIKLLTFD